MRQLTPETFVDPAFPQQVVIEATAACNQQCIFCGRTYMERPKTHMKREVYDRIVEEIAAVSPYTEVWPTFMGEALLLGQTICDMVRHAKRAGCRRVTLNTNGTLLSRKMSEGLIDSGLDRFIVSCDAHTAETHAKVRPARNPRTGGLNEIYENVLEFLKVCEERGSGPIVEMQFSTFDENQHEAAAFREYWLGRGVVVKVRPKVFWSGEVAGADDAARRYEGRTPCLWSIDTAAVHWNGNVVACAIDCDGKYVAGNVTRQSLQEIWKGPLSWIRELHVNRRFKELPEVCRRCPDWKAKRAEAFFPDTPSRERYETYVRSGRTFYEDHGVAGPA
jgi:radical SAM protein with 4Fe4S-binding SPASM domain